MRPMNRMMPAALILLATLACWPATAQDAKPASDAAASKAPATQTGSVIIMITWYMPVLHINSETIMCLVSSANWPTDAGGENVQQAFATFQPIMDRRNGPILGQLTVTVATPDNAASKVASDRHDATTASPAKIIEAQCKRLEAMLREMAQPARDQLNQALRTATLDSQKSAENVKTLEESLVQIRERMRELDVSPNGAPEPVEQLRQQRLALRVELAGLAGRRDALVKHIAAAREQAEKALQQPDATMARLAEVVALRKKDLARRQEANQKVPGSVPQAEVELAGLELRKAEIEMLEFQNKQKQETGGEALQRLNDQLLDAQTEIAGVEARLGVIDETLTRLDSKEVAELLDRFHALSSELPSARERLKKARDEELQFQSSLDNFPMPSVRIIGKPSAAK